MGLLHLPGETGDVLGQIRSRGRQARHGLADGVEGLADLRAFGDVLGGDSGLEPVQFGLKDGEPGRKVTPLGGKHIHHCRVSGRPGHCRPEQSQAGQRQQQRLDEVPHGRRRDHDPVRARGHIAGHGVARLWTDGAGRTMTADGRPCIGVFVVVARGLKHPPNGLVRIRRLGERIGEILCLAPVIESETQPGRIRT
ncbi:hypothetical protein FHU31_001748 [Mycolicibacterium fluoranthenivorans]|uniref:Uncharacterized protein n=1 Tax=Mycolicibacterium fluoranthenivorans TaxID=258505 RepID=A0A7X5TXZ3_9MYCO|nr:hypothetical protein [Mycolicibacterium fluoranthenivorans]NIH94792.1 hypothetical protein [Mycolicibacterium fluoranthenivorans]